ncbi:hypothetical protein AB0M46_51255 [Dactylosporangium sp. NPDC051485]|uniref:hypothetical protein n=1 Tax=Dactylosporangium sp. NPDC051485 TaxID=3154846 RepID=UPI0034289011
MASDNFGPFVTAIVGAATVLFTLNTLRRNDFERARELHGELTSGPVADARHVVGSAFEDPARGKDVSLTKEEIQALFAVLWCFERIDVARSTMLGRWRKGPRWINPRRALDESIRNHVRIYLSYLHRAHINGVPLHSTLTAAEDDAGLTRLGKRLGLTQP